MLEAFLRTDWELWPCRRSLARWLHFPSTMQCIPKTSLLNYPTIKKREGKPLFGWHSETHPSSSWDGTNVTPPLHSAPKSLIRERCNEWTRSIFALLTKSNHLFYFWTDGVKWALSFLPFSRHPSHAALELVLCWGWQVQTTNTVNAAGYI